MESQASVVIIARSAHTRDSLLVLLRAIPRIEAIHQAEDGAAALDLEPEIQPALILLDDDLSGEELRATLGQLKAAWPRARCVVFVDHEQKRRHVQDAGPDLILIKGIRATTLLETIEGAL